MWLLLIFLNIAFGGSGPPMFSWIMNYRISGTYKSVIEPILIWSIMPPSMTDY